MWSKIYISVLNMMWLLLARGSDLRSDPVWMGVLQVYSSVSYRWQRWCHTILHCGYITIYLFQTKLSNSFKGVLRWNVHSVHSFKGNLEVISWFLSFPVFTLFLLLLSTVIQCCVANGYIAVLTYLSVMHLGRTSVGRILPACLLSHVPVASFHWRWPHQHVFVTLSHTFICSLPTIKALLMKSCS